MISAVRKKSSKWRKAVAWGTLAVYLTQPVLAAAQVTADAGAAAQNRPAIEQSASGVPVVQIAAPSEAGVSRNQYLEFNVDAHGLILNNASVITRTSLAGYITGNPNLKGEAARVILNEVTGTGPSYLNGYTEIAGAKADLIIANPNGIAGAGFGFINAGRATLTTGTPVFGGRGSLEAFRVGKGRISIAGAGMDGQRADRVDLISRAVAVNAGMWAKELNVVTGANQVEYASLQARGIAGEGERPAVALDVGALGGMYAGKIHLVGTEKGVGVNSQGTLAAASGNLTLSQSGKISLGGTVSAEGDIGITADEGIESSATIYAGQNTVLSAGGVIENSGVIAAGQNTVLQAGGISSTGTLAAGTDSEGKLNGSGRLSLNAAGQISARGQNLSGGSLDMSGAGLNLAEAVTYAQEDIALSAAQTGIDLSGGKLGGNTIQLAAKGQVGNRSGQIEARNGLTLTAQAFDNHGGQVASLGESSLNATVAGQFNNKEGIFGGNGQVSLAAGQLSNAGGQLTAQKKLELSIGGNIDNSRGEIAGGGDLLISAGNLENGQGKITAGQDLNLAADSLNSSGTLTAGRDISAGVTADTVNTGVIQAVGSIALRSGGRLTSGGTIAAGADLNLSGAGIDLSGADTQAGAKLGIQADKGDIDHKRATMSAGQELNLQAAGRLVNTQGSINGGQLTVSAGAIDNQNGVLGQSGTQTAGISADGTIDNRGGQIAVNADELILAADSLDNRQGQISQAGSGRLTVRTDQNLDNSGGKLASNGQMAVNTAGLDNRQGSIFAQKQLEIQAGGLKNSDGQISGRQNVQLKAKETDNQGGLIEAGGSLSLGGMSLANDRGTIASLDESGLQVDVSGKLSNVSGLIGGNGKVSVSAQIIDNGSGQVKAKTDLAIEGVKGLNNADGVLAAGRDLTVQQTGGSFSNQSGSIQAGSKLTIAAASTDMIGGRMLAGKTADISAGNLTVDELQAGEDALVRTAADFVNAGQVQANGELSVEAGGKVSNAGVMTGLEKVSVAASAVANQTEAAIKSGSSLQLKGKTIDNQGTIYAQKAAAVAAADKLSSAGTIASGSDALLSGRSIVSTGTLAAGLAADGSIGATGNLTVTAAEQAAATGENLAGGSLAIKGSQVDLRGADTQAGQSVRVEATNGDIDHSGASLTAKGQASFSSKGRLMNDEAKVRAAGLSVAAQKISNKGGVLAQSGEADLAISTGELDNTGGEIASNSGNLTIQAGRLDNSGGLIKHAGNGKLTVQAEADFVNAGGEVISNGEAAVTAARLDNTQGVVTAQRKLAIQASELVNRQGQMIGKQAVAISAALDNTEGLIEAGGGLSVSSKTLVNDGGRLASVNADGLTVDVSGKLSNVSGLIGGNGKVSVSAGSIDNADGQMSAKTDLTVKSVSGLTNTDGVLTAGNDLTVKQESGSLGNADGILQAGRNLTVDAHQADLSGGRMLAGKTADVSAKNLRIDELQAGDDVKVKAAEDFANDGQVQANGELRVEAGGRVENAGVMTGLEKIRVTANAVANESKAAIKSGGMLEVSGQTVDNQGIIYGQKAVAVAAEDRLDSAGTIASGSDALLSGKSIVSTGTLAAGLAADGSIGTAGNLTVTAAEQAAATGENLAGGSLSIKGSQVDLRGADTQAGQSVKVEATNGDIDHSGASLTAKGQADFLAKGTLLNDQAIVKAAQLELKAKNISNSGGVLAQSGQADLTIDTGRLENTSGQIAANSKNLSIKVEELDNSEGVIKHAGSGKLTIASNGNFDNRDGEVVSNGETTVSAAQLDNMQGVIYAQRRLDIQANQVVNNQGQLVGKQAVQIAAAVDNTEGLIEAGGGLSVSGKTLVNDSGRLAGLSADGLTVDISGKLSNVSGLIGGNESVRVSADNVDNADGQISAKTDLTIKSADGLTNTDGILAAGDDLTVTQESGILDNHDGVLQAGRNLTIDAHQADISGGRMLAGKTMEINAGNLRIDELQAGEDIQVKTAEDFVNNGQVQANGQLRVEAGAKIRNTGVMTGLEKVSVTGSAVVNQTGAAVKSGGALEVKGQTLDNQGTIYAQKAVAVAAEDELTSSGTIASNADTQLSGKNIASTGTLAAGLRADGLIGTAGDLTVTATEQAAATGQNLAGGNLAIKGSQVDLSGADTQAGQSVKVEATGDIDHSGASLTAQGQAGLLAKGSLMNDQAVVKAAQLELATQNISNRSGVLAQFGQEDLTINAGMLDNAGGQIASNSENLTIQAGQVDNSKGIIKHAGLGKLTIASNGNFDNHDGEVVSNGETTVEAAQVDNTQGVIFAQRKLAIQANQLINNQGQMIGKQDIEIGAAVDNTEGLIEAGTGLSVSGKTLVNNDGRLTSLGSEGLTVDVSGKLSNVTGLIGGNESVSVSAGTVDNSDGQMSAKADLAIKSADGLTNTDGILAAGNDLTVTQKSGGLDNADGILQAGRNLTIDAHDADISGGSLLAGKTIDISAKNLRIDELQAGEDVKVKTAEDFANNGQVQANGELSVEAGGKVTNAGVMIGLENGSVTASAVINESGAAMKSGSTLQVKGKTIGNQGTIYAQRAVAVAAENELTSSGTIASGSDVTLNSKNIASTGTLAAGLSADGSVGTSGNLTVMAAEQAAATGQNLAGGNLAIKGSQVDLSGADTQAGQSVKVEATAEDIDHSGASLTAQGQANLLAKGSLLNDQAAVKAAQLKLGAQEVSNRGGVLAQYGQEDLAINTGKLDNTGGQIASNSENLTIDAGQLDNSQGILQHAGSGKLDIGLTGVFDNEKGQVISNGETTVSAARLDNTQGVIYAQRKLDIQANQVVNNQGQIVGKQAVKIAAAVDNTEGLIEAGAGLGISGDMVVNDGGRLTSLGSDGLTVDVSGKLSSVSGLIGGNGSVSVSAGSVDNMDGQMSAKTDLAIKSADGLKNTDGVLVAGNDLTVMQISGVLDNADGMLQSGNHLIVAAEGADVLGGGMAAGKTAGVTAQNLTIDVLQAGDDVKIKTAGDFVNDGQVQANGGLNIEAGGNVKNAGVMIGLEESSVTGSSVVNQAGAAIKSGGTLQVKGQNIDNEGTIYAKKAVAVAAEDDLTNSGTIASGSDVLLSGQNVASSGTLAAGLSADGSIGAAGNLAVTAAEQAAATGNNLAGADLAIKGGSINLSGANTQAGQSVKVEATAGDIDHRGANLTAKGQAGLLAKGSLLNDQAVVKAAQLELKAKNISNRGGVLAQFGQEDLAISTGKLDNTGGQIASNSENLTIDAAQLDNSQGVLQHAGSGKLDITLTGAFDNEKGQVISNGETTVSAAQLDNMQGVIYAQRKLDIQANQAVNNQGQIVGKQAVKIAAAMDNTQGLIEAGGKLSVSGETLANDSGRLTSLGSDGLTAQISGKLSNVSGLIGGNGSVSVSAGSVDNRDGQMSAKTDLTVDSTSGLNNTDGVVVAGNNLTVTQTNGVLDNHDGILQAGNKLYIAAKGADLAGGRLSAGQTADISVRNLTIDVLQAGDDAKVKTEQDFANDGQVQANGELNIDAGGKVKNTGSILGLEKVSVTASTVVNERGAALKSGGSLTVQGKAVDNQGTIYAREAVKVTAADKLGSNGTIASGADVTLSGQAVASAGTLAAGLNADGTLGSSGNLTVTAAKEITATGQNLAGGNLALRGTSVDLSDANTYAGHTASITATAGDVAVSGGTLAARETLTIQAKTSFSNDQAATKANQLSITAGDIDNRGGLLAQYGQGALLLSTGTLDNSGGQIAANSQNITLTAKHIDNSQGVLQHAGSGKFTLKTATELTNTGGQMIGNGALDLSASKITNSQGTISAKQDLTAEANTIDNKSGVLVSSGKTTLVITGDADNQSGTVEAGKSLAISAKNINNQTGKLTSLDQSGLDLNVQQALNNQQGLIGGNGTADIQAKTLDNTDGQVLSGGSLVIEAESGIDNTGGKLAAGQDVTLQQQQADFTNKKGTVEAGRSLKLQTAKLDNSQGKLAANADAKLSFTALNGTGTISAGRNLGLTIGGDFTNAEGNTWQAVNDLSLTVDGTVANSGAIEAGGSLSVSGRQVSNHAGASMVANDQLTVTATETVLNRGSMFGDDVKVAANHIVNESDTAAIAATNSVRLYAKNALDNKDGALIYSMGNIDIAGGETKNNGEYAVRAKTLTNQSANIEADGDIVIYADDVVNKKSVFEVEQTVVSSDALYPLEEGGYYWYYDKTFGNGNGESQFHELLINDLQIKNWKYVGPGQWYGWDIYLLLRGQSKIETKILEDSPVGKIIAGRNLTLQTNNILNTNSWLLAGKTLFNTGNVVNQASNGSSSLVNHYALANVNYFIGSDLMADVTVEVTSLYDEVVESEATPDTATSLFGGGQKIIIEGTSVSNVNVTPESGIKVSAIDGSGKSGSAAKVQTNTQSIDTGIHTGVSGTTVQGPAVTAITSAGQTGGASAVEAATGNGTNPGIHTEVSGTTVQGPAVTAITSAGQIGGASAVEAAAGNGTNTGISTAVSKAKVQGPAMDGITSAGQAATVTAVQTDTEGNRNTAVDATVSTAQPAIPSSGVTANTTSSAVSQVTPAPAGGAVDLSSVAALLPAARTAEVKAPQTTGGGAIILPQNGLYNIKPDPTAKYLVETNPKFANYKTFISSDYLLDKLNYDPAKTMKRLGDGFYEQKLVREQITDLTGRVYLNGYESAQAQYEALLQNAAAVASDQNLIVGQALTAQQQAALKQDIVWLVEQEVQGQKVLVPVVYLSALREGDLKPSGAVISADNVQINVTGDVTNSGSIQALESVKIGAANVNNIGGTIDSGQLTQIVADQDILNLSGSISGKDVSLIAGGNITSETYSIAMENPYLFQTTLGSTATIAADSSLTAIAGQDLNLLGTGFSAGTDISLSAQNINLGVVADIDKLNLSQVTETVTNLGTTITAGGSLRLQAGQDITLQAAELKAGSDLALLAGGDLNLTAAADTKASDYNWNANNFNNQSTVSNKLTTLDAKDALTLVSGADLTLTGVQATGSTITALSGGNLTLNSVTDSDFSDIKTGGSKNYKRAMTYDETVIGTNLAAAGDITLSAASDLTFSGSSAVSEQGAIKLTAGKDITIEADTERHEALTESKKTKKKTFSKKVTTKRDYAVINQVAGSTLSGQSLDIQSGNDLTVKASSLVAESDLSLAAGNNLTLESMAETGAEDHYKKTKKSGLFSGGGLGFTIGSKSDKLTVQEKTLAEIGSIIGSLEGDVSLSAGNHFTSAGTNLSAGQDINILGKTIDIDNTIDTYDSIRKHEIKQSGLSVTLGGNVIEKGADIANSLERTTKVADERLQALYAYKAYDSAKDLEKLEESKEAKVNISVSIGSSKSSSEQTVHIETVNPSNLSAGESVTITATEGDVSLKGTKIEGKDITIQAKENIHIEAAQNQQQINSTSQSSSWGAGLEAGTGIFGSYQKSSGKESGSTTTNSISQISAEETLTLISGKDTSLIGAKAEGEKVTAQIGGDLKIESLQDKESYREKSNSGGIRAGIGSGVTGSVNKGKINSDYQSVTEQAGIYAGEGGFAIEVGGNTDLKGAVIASEADAAKNRLSTDTLTFGDIENKAEYSASSIGVNLDTRKGAEAKDAGLTPAIGTKAAGDADSTTKSAITEGTIEVRNGNTDLSKLSRDTATSLNALDKIFDKKTVEEQQELAKVFGEVAFEQVHKISKANGWDEGSPQKIALHAFVGAVMADMGGGNALSGAAGAGLNEAVQKELAEMFKDNPDMHQWASAIIGTAAATVVGGDAQTGGSTAASGTKNNFLSKWQEEERARQLANCTSDEERKNLEAYWDSVDKVQDKIMAGTGWTPEVLKNDDNLMQLVAKMAQEEIAKQNVSSAEFDISIIDVDAMRATVLVAALNSNIFDSIAQDRINKIYSSIKQSPKYPEGFNTRQNGTQKYNVNNQELLSKLREIEPGEWKKVYKDGFDASGNKISIHYFESKSGKVFDVDVKSGWSNQ